MKKRDGEKKNYMEKGKGTEKLEKTRKSEKRLHMSRNTCFKQTFKLGS